MKTLHHRHSGNTDKWPDDHWKCEHAKGNAYTVQIRWPLCTVHIMKAYGEVEMCSL